MLQVDSVTVIPVAGGGCDLFAPLPQSVNAMYQRTGRTVRKSDTAKAYQHLLSYAFNLVDVEPIDGLVNMQVSWYFKTMRSDIDNRVKLLMDALEGHCYANDNQIVNLCIKKRLLMPDETEPYCHVIVRPSELTRADLSEGD